MSWYELKHAWRDFWGGDGWHDYPYAKRSPLAKIERMLRKSTCSRKGHRFAGGEHGEYRATTWKRWCLVCFEIPDWAKEET